MINQVLSIRGATTVAENTAEAITIRSVELLKEIIERNGLNNNGDLEATDMLISTTADLTAAYPAKAVRESGLINTSLFSMQEPTIQGALPMCIRFMIRVSNYGERVEPRHVYLHEAKKLRPDLAGK